METPPNITQPAAALDLFCGIGGLSLGLQHAGIPIYAGIDHDPSCRYPYEHNTQIPFHTANLTAVHYSDLHPLYKNAPIRILAGCAPCQPYSPITNTPYQEDPRSSLLDHFLRLILQGLPELIIMENVPNLLKTPLYHQFRDNLLRAGYFLADSILQAAHYNVPQKRKRLILLGSRLAPIHPPRPDQQPTPQSVADAIKHLPPLQHGHTDPNDNAHKTPRLTELNIKRIRATKPGKNWRDWPEELWLPCTKKALQQGKRPFNHGYRRLEWDKPADTITTIFFKFGGTGRFGHPQQDRALSLREGSLLQSFPPSFQFAPPEQNLHTQHTGRHIGNAVPPNLAQAIGLTILKHINTHKDQPTKKDIPQRTIPIPQKTEQINLWE